MSFCEYCGYDVPGPCENARVAARCQSLRSTCDFCGHDVHLPCEDAEAAKYCRMQPRTKWEERPIGIGRVYADEFLRFQRRGGM